MGPEDQFIKSVPGPEIPGDPSFTERLRGAASDASAAAKGALAFLAGSRWVTIDTADGQRMRVLAKNVQPSAGVGEWWECLPNGAGGATVPLGCIIQHLWRYSGGTFLPVIQSSTIVFEDVAVVDLENGDYICVECPLQDFPESFEYAVAGGAGGSVQVLAKLMEPDTSSLLVLPVPDLAVGPSNNTFRWPIARYISAGNIRQLHRGVIEIPPLLSPYTG